MEKNNIRHRIIIQNTSNNFHFIADTIERTGKLPSNLRNVFDISFEQFKDIEKEFSLGIEKREKDLRTELRERVGFI